jgi:hypothetical protein
MGALEAIKYSDGKLQLLDQRLLPLETVYLDVPDPKAAWQQIKVSAAAEGCWFVEWMWQLCVEFRNGFLQWAACM